MSDTSVATATTSATCPNCGADNDPGSRFCEACGFRLVATAEPHVPVPPSSPAEVPAAPVVKAADAPQPCAACGGRIAEDGYCEQCGTPAPVPVPERDHWGEEPAPGVAGVCDRGIRHRRNEDAMAIAAGEALGGVAVLVVCDGVSSSRDSDIASLAAARAARDVLVEGLPDAAADWPARLRAAASAAQRAAAGGGDDDPTAGQAEGLAYSVAPSCTLVVGVRDGRRLHVGNVGDSRAYWMPDSGPARQLSVDDSWAAEQIALGVPPEVAENGPRGHAITRWLGADSPDHDPHPVVFDVSEGTAGWLMVVSDGLWNYCSPADDLQELVARQSAALPAGPEGTPDPVALAGVLVDWANAQGGRDNITVTLARVGERSA